MCSNQSFRPAPKEDLPHTAEELRVMKKELDRIRDEFLNEENELLKKIHRAQEAIRKDIEQKKAKTKLEDEAWVFEKAANGWI
jgi:hypothetical protein